MAFRNTSALKIGCSAVLLLALVAGQLAANRLNLLADLRELQLQQLRIVNGTPVAEGRYPFHAGIRTTSGGVVFRCAGTLIDSKHILTAAHCFTRPDEQVFQTTVYLNTTIFGASSAVTRSLSKITVHSGYQGAETNFVNDIAVLALDFPVTELVPVRLPDNEKTKGMANETSKETSNGAPNVTLNEVLKGSGTSKGATNGMTKETTKRTTNRAMETFAGQRAIVIGYGALVFGGSVQNILHQVSVTVQTNSNCSLNYGHNIPETNMCVFSPGHGSCQGDSGGPLLLASGMQIAIVSYAISCGSPQFFSVYTRVSSYLDWIQAATQNTL